MFVSQEFEKKFMCEKSKEVWDIMETTREGTKTVKNSKLQMLTSTLEEIRMKLLWVLHQTKWHSSLKL